MVNLLSATRSFEANVQSMNAIKELARKSLEIGK
jgi:flagellar basal body rod protein FlgC